MLFNDANTWQFQLKGNVRRVGNVYVYLQEDPKLEQLEIQG